MEFLEKFALRIQKKHHNFKIIIKVTNIQELAKNAISIEISELISLKERINETFEKAIHLIFNSTGKLIIVGIGKSAHVANKIVATLNSTGTPSQFLHAAEAIHGDLGVIKKTMLYCVFQILEIRQKLFIYCLI
jgi:arabinose-5-phosphate isomerase